MIVSGERCHCGGEYRMALVEIEVGEPQVSMVGIPRFTCASCESWALRLADLARIEAVAFPPSVPDSRAASAEA